MEIPKRQMFSRSLRQLRRTWVDVGQTARNRLSGAVRTDLPSEDYDLIRRQIDGCLSDSGGAVSARARAANLGGVYLGLNRNGRARFLRLLGQEYGVDRTMLGSAAETWLDSVKDSNVRSQTGRSDVEAEESLRKVLVAPRIKLLTRFNELPEGVKFLVDMRAELLEIKAESVQLGAFDREFRDLLASWFDVGFLELRRITWDAPAALIEQLASHEAVHAIRSWQDIKHRLAASDRCCYAFIHPQMPNDPLIFVWVALTHGLPDKIQDLLEVGRSEASVAKADTAVFYSISATEPGLDGVALGSFLIKRVVDQLSRDNKHLRVFSTLSPIPGFRIWLGQQLKDVRSGFQAPISISELLQKISVQDEKRIFSDRSWARENGQNEHLRKPLLALAAYYLIKEKRGIVALDKVANFHLSNGATVERLNWLGDISRKGQEEAGCLMINYRYRLKDIESNHENYHTMGDISYSKSISVLVQQ